MDSESFIRLAVFILMFTAFSISGYYRRKADRAGKDEITFEGEGRFIKFFRPLFALAGFGGIFSFLVYPPLVSWAQLDLPLWIRWAGVATMLVMLPFLYWMFTNLGNNISPTVITREKHQLVTTGPYKWIRHPLYTFGFINFTGVSIASANWFIFLMLTLGMGALAFRTPIEEKHLIEKFGEQYINYIKSTGRYLPKIG